LPAQCNNQAEVEVRWKYLSLAANDGGTRPRIRLDDITIDSEELDPEDPALLINESLSSFEQYVGTPSSVQSLEVSGENLTSSVLLATNSPYEISLNAATGFDSELTLSPIAETLNTTTIYVRMNASQEGFYSNILTFSGGGLSNSITLPLNGTATIYEPPYNLSFPTPYVLKNEGNYSLNEWNASNASETYPKNAIFHVYENEPTENEEPVTDWLCSYDLSARSRINGLGANGFSFFNTASAQDESQCGSLDGTGIGGHVGDFVMAINTEEMENIRVSFLVELLNQSSGNPQPRNYGLELMYRTDELSPWLNLPTKINYQTAQKTQNEVTNFVAITLPEAVNNQALVQLRWQYFSIEENDGGSRPRIRMDDFLIEGDEILVLNPSLTVTEVLNPFHQVLGTASEPQLFLVEGEELINPLQIEVPYPYLISLDENINYSNTITLYPDNLNIALTPIFVKLNAVETGVFERNIQLTTNELTETIYLVGETHEETPTPQLTTNTDSLAAFIQPPGEPSNYQFFIIHGLNLEGDIQVVVNAPFEIATSSNGNYQTSLILNETNGTVNFQPIFVRLNASEAGNYSETLYITGGGLSPAKEIFLSGTTMTTPLPETSWELDSLTNFTQEIGNPSAVEKISLSTSHIQSNVTLTVDAPFEISRNELSNFSQEIILSQEEDFPNDIYIRLNATLADTFTVYLIASSAGISDTCFLKGVSTEPVVSELMHYWHFNHLIHQLEEHNERLELRSDIKPNYSASTINASIKMTGFMDSRQDLAAYPVSNKNLQLGVPPNHGGWLRVNNPSHAAQLEINFSSTNFKELKLDYVTARNEDGAQFQTLHYSIDNGLTWELIATQLPTPVLNHQENWQNNHIDLSLLTELNNQTNVIVRISFEGTNTTGSSGFCLLDNLSIKGIPIDKTPSPAIHASPISLTPFYHRLDNVSPEQTLLVAAKNTTGAVSIIAPPHYAIKTSAESNFSNTINLLSTQGELQTTPLDIRLNASNVGSHNDSLSITTGGITTKIPLFGFCATNYTPNESELIYYWHFNQLNTVLADVKLIPADFSLTDSIIATLRYEGAGIRDLSASANGAILNLQQNTVAGQALTVNNSALNRELIFDLPTTGISDLVFEYAVKRDFEGMQNHQLSYSTDGTTYTDVHLQPSSHQISQTYELLQYDFSAINEVNYNPNFKIKIVFEGNTSLSAGVNYFDNISLKGNASRLGIETKTNFLVSVYPNPCESIVNISSVTPIVKTEVYSISGALLGKKDYSGENYEVQLDVGTLNPGTYIVKVYDLGGQVVVRRVSKM
jgi:hypothetical protein